MEFENNILLSLKRKYSKSEEVAFIIDKLKNVEYENGVLKSSIAELEHNIKLRDQAISKQEQTIDELRRKISHIHRDLIRENKLKTYRNQIKKLKKDKRKFQDQYLSLLHRCNNSKINQK